MRSGGEEVKEREEAQFIILHGLAAIPITASGSSIPTMESAMTAQASSSGCFVLVEFEMAAQGRRETRRG